MIKCRNASKYKAERAPKCGCLTCFEKWQKRWGQKLAYVSVNRQIIARNSRNGTSEPAISVRVGRNGKPHYVKQLKIEGDSRMFYDPAKPILKCGARLVIVTMPDYVGCQTSKLYSR